MAPRSKHQNAIVEHGAKRPAALEKDAHWHRLPVGAPVHDHVVPFGETLQRLDSSEHSKNRTRERIYEGRMSPRISTSLRSGLARAGIRFADLNALKAVIDTFVSRLSKDRPMPSFLTEGAAWKIKRKSRLYRQFLVGKMAQTEFDDLSREALQDGTIYGQGWTRIDDDENDVVAERMFDSDVLFDPRECKYGKPRNAIHVHRVARDHLAELFPKLRQQIESAAPSRTRPEDQDDSSGLSATDLEDYVDVWQAWHLPSTCDGDDGRAVQCIDGATLTSVLWHEPRFPWSMFRLFKPRRGLRGMGFVDQLAELQNKVNAVARDLQMNLAAFGRGYVAVNAANDIPADMLGGWQPYKLKYSGGRPPEVQMPQPFNPAQLDALQFFIGQMFDLTGVSQTSATSKSSLGAGASGVALDTQYDIDSDRFRMPQANYARYRLDGAQCYLDAAARVARRRKEQEGTKRQWVSVSRSWKNQSIIDKLEYGKVALGEDEYQLTIEPVGFLPDTRAGKLSVVEQLAKAGVIPQWLVPTLFDDPDLVQANRITLSAFRNCIRKMDLLADEDEEAPVPCAYNDLDLELKIAIAYYNFTEEDGAPLEVLDRYDTYIKLLKELIKMKSGGDVAAPMPPPGGMPGPGGAPPMTPAMPPMPGGVPMMPQGPVPAPMPIGAPPQMAI